MSLTSTAICGRPQSLRTERRPFLFTAGSADRFMLMTIGLPQADGVGGRACATHGGLPIVVHARFSVGLAFLRGVRKD